MLRTAPHLVHPLHFLIPVYAEGSRSARVIRLGIGDRVVGVRLHHGGRELTVRAGHVVNAAGPWVDQVLAGLPGERGRLIGGTKGSHLVVRRFPGAPQAAVYTEAVDNRPYFIVPWAGNKYPEEPNRTHMLR